VLASLGTAPSMGMGWLSSAECA